MKLLIITNLVLLSVFARAEDLDLLRKANKAYDEGKYEEAVELLKDYPDFDQSLKARKLLASVKLKQKRYAEAGAMFEKLVAEGDVQSLTGLGFSKVALSDLRWLSENKKTLLDKVPENVDLMRVFVLWSVKMKDVRPFEEALELVSDEEIMGNPVLNETVLKGYRVILKEALTNARSKK